jgi:cyanamide hydratase
LAIKSHLFPSWAFTDETYFLTCLLHDIGSTEENLKSTKLSFEFYGGFLALDVLQNPQASAPEAASPRDQAESVAEAIIRHQDLCETGKITAVGQLLQLATIFGESYLPWTGEIWKLMRNRQHRCLFGTCSSLDH